MDRPKSVTPFGRAWTWATRRLAEREWTLLDAETRAVLQAYAAGVNAFTACHRPPVEFVLLRQRPRPWEPVDTAQPMP